MEFGVITRQIPVIRWVTGLFIFRNLDDVDNICYNYSGAEL